MKRKSLVYNRDGLKFIKSSFSPMSKFCVGVSIGNESVKVTNTKDPNAPIVEFTQDEWNAFVMGVKNNEFDI